MQGYYEKLSKAFSGSYKNKDVVIKNTRLVTNNANKTSFLEIITGFQIKLDDNLYQVEYCRTEKSFQDYFKIYCLTNKCFHISRGIVEKAYIDVERMDNLAVIHADILFIKEKFLPFIEKELKINNSEVSNVDL